MVAYNGRSVMHILITWPLASEQAVSYATPQCVGILLTFFIIQDMWPFDVWKQVQWQMLGRVQRKNTTELGCSVMLYREWRWCRNIHVQSVGKVIWAGLAWNKTISHNIYILAFTQIYHRCAPSTQYSLEKYYFYHLFRLSVYIKRKEHIIYNIYQISSVYTHTFKPITTLVVIMSTGSHPPFTVH